MLPGTQAMVACFRLGKCRPPKLRPFIPHRRYDVIAVREPISKHPMRPHLIPDSPDFWQHGMRPFQFSFEPAEFPIETRGLNFLQFLLPIQKHRYPEWKYANSIHPPTAGVPWPTSFTHTFQSKYWHCAENELPGFMSQMISKELVEEEPWRAEYIQELVDAAVDFVINVFPTASPSRLIILAKVYGVLFMHDDTLDLGDVPDNPGQGEGSPRGLRKSWLNRLSAEALNESPAQGRDLLTNIEEWASLDKDEGKIPETLNDYLHRRIQNAGAYPVFRSVEFSCRLNLSDAERESVQTFNSFCAEHFVLTNDLYSHAREVAEANDERPPFNAIVALQSFSDEEVTAQDAKQMLRKSLIQTEQDICREYLELYDAYGHSDIRVKYARGVVIALAGNMFYSATCRRYGKYAQKDDGDVFDEW